MNRFTDPRPYLAWHYHLTNRDIERALSDGRRFYSVSTHQYLPTSDDIKAAFLKDNREVMSEP